MTRVRERWLAAVLNRVDSFTKAPEREGAVHPSWSPGAAPVRIAIVGCGFVADFYTRWLAAHPELRLLGVVDRDEVRAAKLAGRCNVRAYGSMAAMLADKQVELVVNLTNPASHFLISKACLEAGKHLYSEKPLALSMAQAEELVHFAGQQGLQISGAPCSLLGETAQALGQALRDGDIGRVRLVYAELDDGPIHQMRPQEWASPEGTPWPWRDEFAVGCTLEHAAYYLTWLVTFFGAAESVTAFSSLLVPERLPDILPHRVAPDFAVGCIRFRSGVVARLTCGTVGPHHHGLQIVGDRGILSIDECWHNATPIRWRCHSELGFRADTYSWLSRYWPTRFLFGLNGKRHWRSPKPGGRIALRRHYMDYLLGVSDLAASIRTGRRPCLSPSLLLHVTEIALAMHESLSGGEPYRIRSTYP